MKNIAVILSALLLLAMLFSCGNVGEKTETESSETAQATEAVIPGFQITEDFVIIRSNTDEDGAQACLYLKKAIEAVYGVRVKIDTDYVKSGTEMVPNEHEILVGVTNRPESVSLNEGLKTLEYGYKIFSDRVIAVYGGNDDSLTAAAEQFAQDCLGYRDEKTYETATLLKAGSECSYTYSYPVQTFTINGENIENYQIVCSGNFKTCAEEFAGMLSDVSGYQPEIVKEVEEGKRGIYLNQPSDTECGPFEYHFDYRDGDLWLEALTKDNMEICIDDFFDTYLQPEAGETYNLALTEKTVKYNFEGEDNGLVVERRESKKVCDGVKYLTIHYRDKDNKPVIASVLIIEPGAATPYLGTPDDSGVFEKGNVASLISMAEAAEEKQGFDVCAICNGALASEGYPVGLNVSGGKKLTKSSVWAIFGMYEDGTYFAGYESQLDKTKKLEMAVGGSYMLIQNGIITDIGHGEEFSYVRHPRTSIGYDDEGRLYIVEVDGRQPEWSNGASLADLALIHLSLGVTNAVNIDGGGSSMIYCKNYATGNFVTKNKSSDGSPRSVVNCVLFVRNPDYKEN